MNNNENVSEQPDEGEKCVAILESLIEDQTYMPELISVNVSIQGIVAWIKQEPLRKIKIFSDILQTRSFTKKHLGKIGFSVDRIIYLPLSFPEEN